MQTLFLEEILYNWDGNSPQLIFLNVHWDNWEIFLNQYPEILRAIPESENLLKTAIKLDGDAFAWKIIENIAKKLWIPILELRVCVPRFIIDSNRNPSLDLLSIQSPLRHIFNFENHKLLTNNLLLIHKKIVNRITQIISKFWWYVIDLHTMANISPKTQIHDSIAIKEQVGDIKGYIDKWINANGEKRKINIMTKLKNKQDLANMPLSLSLAWELTFNNFQNTFNDPYILTPNLMSTTYMMLNWKTILIDIPKGTLSKESQDTNRHLANLTLCPQKLDILSLAFVSAINKFV